MFVVLCVSVSKDVRLTARINEWGCLSSIHVYICDSVRMSVLLFVSVKMSVLLHISVSKDVCLILCICE